MGEHKQSRGYMQICESREGQAPPGTYIHGVMCGNHGGYHYGHNDSISLVDCACGTIFGHKKQCKDETRVFRGTLSNVLQQMEDSHLKMHCTVDV